MGILRRVKVFSHFSPTGCSLVSTGDSVDFLPCRYSLRFLVDREDRIFSYFLRCQSLFISRGVDDVEEHPSLSGAREGEVCMKYKDHHTRHPRGHLGDRASAQGARGCAAHGATINLDGGKTLCWADRGRHYENQSDESSRRTKLCAAQTAPGAGATL